MEDGAQRRAQLVRQRRQELVLGPRRGLRPRLRLFGLAPDVLRLDARALLADEHGVALVLELLPLRHVVADGPHADHLPVPVADDRRARLEPARGLRRAHLEGARRRRSARRVRHPEEPADLGVGRMIGETAVARAAEELLRRHAEAACEGGIHVREPPAAVGREDQLPRVLGEVAVGVARGVQGAAALDLVPAMQECGTQRARRPFRDPEGQQRAEDDRAHELDPRPVEGEVGGRQQPGNGRRRLHDECWQPAPAEEDRGGEVERHEDEREQIPVGAHRREQRRLRDTEQHGRHHDDRNDARRLRMGTAQCNGRERNGRDTGEREQRVTRRDQRFDDEDGMPRRGNSEPAEREPRQLADDHPPVG